MIPGPNPGGHFLGQSTSAGTDVIDSRIAVRNS